MSYPGTTLRTTRLRRNCSRVDAEGKGGGDPTLYTFKPNQLAKLFTQIERVSSYATGTSFYPGRDVKDVIFPLFIFSLHPI